MALVALLVVPVVRAEAAEPDAAWGDAVLRAGVAAKPIVAFVRPDDCVTPEGDDPCKAFEKTVAHPAIQRRLADVVYVTRTGAWPLTIAAYDPAGTILTSWTGISRPVDFSRILTLVDGASSDLAAAHRAAMSDRQDLALRHRALAFLSLGVAARGRELLDEMQGSESVENRELATLWLDAMLAPAERRQRNRELLTRMGESGSTRLVRFEALMALGDLQATNGEGAAAIEAFSRAARVAPDARLAATAGRARQRAVDRHSPFVGIGEHAGVVIGRRTLKPREVPKTATSGELSLNGRVVARDLRPPFITTIDFGRVPKRQVVQFTPFDPRGRPLQRATTVVNERRDAFAVRIVEPDEIWTSGRVRVTATATVPAGRQIDEVAIEWRGSTAARLVTPPYATEIEVAPQEEGLLRVVLRLDDGSEVDDARILNAGAMTMSSEVHLVEIPVHVEGPVPAAADIVLREDGKRRAVERVVTAKDAPLRIALLLDTSLSMTDHLLDLQESAARFVERNLVPSDRATLIAFGGSESVLWPTSDRQKIIRTILSLQPRGGTALYSAIVSAFFNLQSAGCRRAIVLFTDGADTGSTFSVAEVEEVARRMAVPLYVLAFTQSPSGFTPHRGGRGPASYESSTFERSEGRRALQRIARDSGGKLFELQSLRDVDAIWNAIAKELRQQALVVFRASESGGSWRALDLRSPRTVLRAPQGIYVSAAEPRGN